MTRSTLVPFRITVCGIEELHGHCEAGVSHVLSILDPGRDLPPAFGSYGEHVRLDLRFDDIIEEMPEKAAPQLQHVESVLAFGRELAAEADAGAHLLVHCHMGVSRSTACMALILAQTCPERPAAEILAEVVRIRPIAWPNLRILEIGDRLLGRGGDLVEALRPVYRASVDRPMRPGEPDWPTALERWGRGREIRHMRG
ncbi:tyrosine phosphatase family protein [Oleisolibacter albus]|uniref:tyrosine phosphatase family protein n=1 Tax=Oleisolibacter albus TaxID=2171757 RepID=UPI001EFE4DCC|nr:protein-tyrosine-phosphatase [Oleisolibacter albus]